jgi:tetratricopeptide (TPR) repeat protein
MARQLYNAVVSGRAGVAMLVAGPRVYSIDAGSSEPVERRAEEFHLLFGSARDLEFFEDVSPAGAAGHLSLASEREQALDLILILLDRDYPADIRTDAALDLEETLLDSRVAHQLEAVMFSAPLPAGTNVAGAIVCTPATCPRVRGFLDRLQKFQPVIRWVRHAGDEAAGVELASATERHEADTACVRAGVHRTLVEAIDSGASLDAALVGLMTNPVLARLLPRHTIQRLFGAWKRFLIESGVVTVAPRRYGAADTDQDASDDWVAEDRIDRFDRTATGQQARQQVARIMEQVKAGNIDTARRWVEQLIAWHLQYHQGEQFACKSLCNLAIGVQEIGCFALQRELTERAVSLYERDFWAWCQLGKARLNCGDFAEALTAYEQAAAAHPGDAVPKNGRAEVLKSMGRYAEALTAYEEATAVHPEDVVAKTGRAEVLKAMGRYAEALTAYEEATAVHPESVVAKTGRAEVLKAMGRYAEALTAYEEATAVHPEDVVAKNGRAEVLKAMGRYAEALTAYEQAGAEDPEDVVAKNGRAEVLKAMGRYPEAREAYQSVREQHPVDRFAANGLASVLVELGDLDQAWDLVNRPEPIALDDWIGEHVRGMILVCRGQLADAIDLFQRGLDQCPFLQSRSYFCTALIATRMRLGQLEAAGKLLGEEAAPELAEPVRALWIEWCGRRGDTPEATRHYHRAAPPGTLVAQQLFGELECRFVLCQPPRRDDDWLLRQQLRFQSECLRLSL